MHGQEGREVAARAERPGGPRRAGPACERGELAVGDDLPPLHLAQRLRARPVEAAVEDERHVAKVVGSAGEEGLQPSRQVMTGV